MYINSCKNVWKLCETHNLTKEELVCLFYTFDYALTGMIITVLMNQKVG